MSIDAPIAVLRSTVGVLMHFFEISFENSGDYSTMSRPSTPRYV